MGILLIIIVCLIIVFAFLLENMRNLEVEISIYKIRVTELRNKIQILRNFSNSEAGRLQIEVDYLRKENARLRQIISGHHQAQCVSAFSVPSGTLEAVKYAMKHSHPDNGGSTDDFIRFKKCYEELIGR